MRNSFFLTLLLLIGCSQREQHEKIYILDGENMKQVPSLQFSDYFESIEYVSLSNKVITQGSYIHLGRDRIYTADQYGIYSFSRKGEFLNRVGRVGHGPAEYLSAIDYSLDNENERIYVSDYSTKKIKVFDVKGNYVKNILPDIDDFWDTTVYSDNRLYLFPSIISSINVKSEKLWYVSDTLGNVLSTHNNMTKFSKEGGQSRPYGIGRSGDGVTYWNHYNDTIFGITSTKSYPKYIWTQGDYRFTPDDAATFPPRTGAMSVTYIFDTPKALLVFYSQKGAYIGIYDKQTREFLKVLKSEFRNDIDGGLNFNTFELYYDENQGNAYLIRKIMPEELIEFAKDNTKHILSPDLQNLADTISEDDNPIIMIARLKK